MIEVTGIEQKRAWQERQTPPLEQVRSSIWSIPVDCADLPIRHTFAYVIIGDNGRYILIDPGLDTPQGSNQLQAGLGAAGLDPSNLEGILVTHFHMDHIGGAPALSQASSAWFGMHELELLAFPGWPDPEDVYHRYEHALDVWGVPDIANRPARLGPDEYLPVAPKGLPDRLIGDGDRLELPGRNLEVMWTPGHTAGHLCIIDHDEQVVFTGDHVLPRITPNVSSYAHDLAHDSVADYNASLERIGAYDEYEVLPAHEYRFRGLRERTQQLRSHMDERSAEVAEVAARGFDTTWEVAKRLTWKRGWEGLDDSNLRAALGETHAHMIHQGIASE